MKYYGQSHIGSVRKLNQDQFVLSSHSDLHLMVVCDGMGGANAGEVASEQACQSLKLIFNEHPPVNRDVQSLAAWLKQAILEANKNVFALSQTQSSYFGMGTTLVAALVNSKHTIVANVGDSRAYILDKTQALVQVTHDHSLVQQWLTEGKISADEAKSHPQRSVLTNALGVSPNVKVDVFEVDVPYTKLLLCSDGVHGMMEDAQLHDLLAQSLSAKELSHAIIEMALFKGGLDNITVTLAVKETL